MFYLISALQKFDFKLLETEHPTNGDEWKVIEAVTKDTFLTGHVFSRQGYPRAKGPYARRIAFEGCCLLSAPYSLFQFALSEQVQMGRRKAT